MGSPGMRLSLLDLLLCEAEGRIRNAMGRKQQEIACKNSFFFSPFALTHTNNRNSY